MAIKKKNQQAVKRTLKMYFNNDLTVEQKDIIFKSQLKERQSMQHPTTTDSPSNHKVTAEQSSENTYQMFQKWRIRQTTQAEV